MAAVIFLDEWKAFLKTIEDIENDPQDAPAQKENSFIVGKHSELASKFLKEFLAQRVQEAQDYISKFHRETLIEIKNNAKVMEIIWGEGFALFAFYIQSCTEFCDALLEYIKDSTIDENTDGIKTFGVVRFLNGRAIQVANEILVLMRNGYADGAYSRFRTLFEISVVTSFIRKYGDEVSEDFVNYSGTKYGWAARVFPNYKNPETIPFSEIKSKCGIDNDSLKQWDHEYSITNKLIHASPQGTFSRISQIGPMDEIPIGPVDYGMIVPATNSLQSLFQINKDCFCCLADPIVNLWIMTLHEIKRLCYEKFLELEKKNFPSISEPQIDN